VGFGTVSVLKWWFDLLFMSLSPETREKMCYGRIGAKTKVPSQLLKFPGFSSWIWPGCGILGQVMILNDGKTCNLQDWTQKRDNEDVARELEPVEHQPRFWFEMMVTVLPDPVAFSVSWIFYCQIFGDLLGHYRGPELPVDRFSRLQEVQNKEKEEKLKYLNK
jgi:hypothetical protein